MKNLTNMLLYLFPNCMIQKKGTKKYTRTQRESQILNIKENFKIFDLKEQFLSREEKSEA